MIEHPVYFLTWTTYGTWLPGDERGWVDRKISGPETPIRDADTTKQQQAATRLKDPPVKLTTDQRLVVEKTVREVCQHKEWRLLAVNCRTNHVHVVVCAPDVPPELVLNTFKSWASRRLNEAEGRTDRPKRWTRHGSTRWLKTEESVYAAIRYVREGTDRL